MKIGIDAHGVGGHSLGHGNETYFRNLVLSLAAIDSDNEYHVFVNHPESLANSLGARANVRLVTLRPRSQWFQRPVSLPIYSLRWRLDLVHCPFVRTPRREPSSRCTTSASRPIRSSSRRWKRQG
jgi:hypothetical protein